MPIKVSKVADVIDGELVFAPSARTKDRQHAKGVLQGLFPRPSDIRDKIPAHEWFAQMYPDPLGELNKYLSGLSYSGVDPVFINFLPEGNPTELVYFRDRLFMTERIARASEQARS
jgi:hypothetical protein